MSISQIFTIARFSKTQYLIKTSLFLSQIISIINQTFTIQNFVNLHILLILHHSLFLHLFSSFTITHSVNLISFQSFTNHHTLSIVQDSQLKMSISLISHSTSPLRNHHTLHIIKILSINYLLSIVH